MNIGQVDASRWVKSINKKLFFHKTPDLCVCRQEVGVVYLSARRGQHNTVCGSKAVHRAAKRQKHHQRKAQRLKRNVGVRSHSSDTICFGFDRRGAIRARPPSLHFPLPRQPSPGNGTLLMNSAPHSSAALDL